MAVVVSALVTSSAVLAATPEHAKLAVTLSAAIPVVGAFAALFVTTPTKFTIGAALIGCTAFTVSLISETPGVIAVSALIGGVAIVATLLEAARKPDWSAVTSGLKFRRRRDRADANHHQTAGPRGNRRDRSDAAWLVELSERGYRRSGLRWWLMGWAASSAIAVVSLLASREPSAAAEHRPAWSIGLALIGLAPLLGLAVDRRRDRHGREQDERDGSSPTLTALIVGAAFASALFVLASYVGDVPSHGLPATALALAVLVLLGGTFAIGAEAAIRGEESRKNDAYQARLAAAAATMHAETVAATLAGQGATQPAKSCPEGRSAVERGWVRYFRPRSQAPAPGSVDQSVAGRRHP